MKIKYKAFWMFSSIFITYSLINYIVQKTVIFPRFIQFENDETKRYLDRVNESILNEIINLDSINQDWSTRKDTFQYFNNLDQNKSDYYLGDDSIKTNRISLIHFYNTKKNLVWGKVFGINMKEQTISLEIPQDKLIIYDDNTPINKLSETYVRGILDTSHGPLLISSRPMIMNNKKGPLIGYLVMGRLLNKENIRQMIERIRIHFEIILKSNSQYKYLLDKIVNLDYSSSYFQEKESKTKINAYSVFHNIDNIPSFITKISSPRDVVINGKASLNFAFFSNILAGLLVLLPILYIMGRTFIIPITTLTHKMKYIEDKADYSQRIHLKGNDEIGMLSQSFNQLISNIEQKTNALEKIASLDPLTQLTNRRTFDACFDVEWRRMFREKKFLSIILIDVDYFKNFNDYYGHQEGDKCLKKVGETIAEQVKRAGDVAGRYGGEEFIVLLPKTNYQGAIHVAERLRQAIHDLKIQHKESEANEYVTCSIGISTLIPCEETSKLFLVKSADEALYMAKHAGRNRVAGIYGS